MEKPKKEKGKDGSVVMECDLGVYETKVRVGRPKKESAKSENQTDEARKS